jgi:hypothetical protein
MSVWMGSGKRERKLLAKLARDEGEKHTRN